MLQLLYLEVPTPHWESVRQWLQQAYCPLEGKKSATPSGCVLETAKAQLSVFLWSVQRTTYLKVFRWSQERFPQEDRVLVALTEALRRVFPYRFPGLPDRGEGSIFQALAQDYPLTVEYFQQFPQGEFDLERVYWWEKRWRSSVTSTVTPPIVVTSQPKLAIEPEYDLVYLGGALGAIHAAMMARLGYRVCVLERLPFGRMNREWNISRAEFTGLITMGLFSEEEFAALIACEYRDGFNKFFDGNNPPHLLSPVLHTPHVLNIALDAQQLLERCGQKIKEAGGTILDRVQFETAIVGEKGVEITATQNGSPLKLQTRLVIDAMGSASPIAQQINQGRAFDSVCPTVGAVVKGFDPAVWDRNYGDVLSSHGDIARGRQLIWELFPGKDDEVAIYLFHYHQIHPENPGSLLEMYEDFFGILPEYRRCDLAQLTWIKPTFGYIPGFFSRHSQSRCVSFDRVLSIGDAAALQSPLVFTGFGSLVRNLPRLTTLLAAALDHDRVSATDLQAINAYQSNVAVTWLFSKGMMVPTGMHLPPQRINAMLNTFFGVLAAADPIVSDRFIKDRVDWWTFNQLALLAASKNPQLIAWIWQMAGWKDIFRWLASYAEFTWGALWNGLLGGWCPGIIRRLPPWFAQQYPQLWFRLLCWSYGLGYSVGMPE